MSPDCKALLQTTNTEQFIVSPPYGIVEPGTTKLVKVYFKAHKAYTDNLRFCKDCFLVQSIVVEPELTDREITSDLFRSRQRQEARLKVLVVSLISLLSLSNNLILIWQIFQDAWKTIVVRVYGKLKGTLYISIQPVFVRAPGEYSRSFH